MRIQPEGTSAITVLALGSFMVLGGIFYPQTVVPVADPKDQQVKSVTQTTAKGTETRRQRPGSPSKRDVTDKGADPESPCYRDAYRLVSDFFGTDPDNFRKGARRDVMELASEKDYTLEFLVASLHDPVDSRTGWRYDLFLDAIERALEANDYVPDRFSLPWKCTSEATKADINNPPSIQDKKPGVILFRHLTQTHLLVLFLIGEVPTSGIHKGALVDALNCMSDCKKWDQEVKLIGPSASGSVKSLKFAIEEWYDEATRKQRKNLSALRFTIVSGSATNPSNKTIIESASRRFETGLPGNKNLLQPLPDGNKRMNFHATVVPDDIALEKFRQYLGRLDPNAKVAVLRELNTGYGGGLKAPMEQGPSATNWLALPFPLQISQVRTAYEKDLRLKARSTPHATGTDSRLTLDLPLDEIGEPQDVSPALTPLMTDAAIDLVLANILSTISREGIQYVGLLGTDTRDKLFLGRLIRKYCPDVRLFTLESDILYTHPSYNTYLQGMIVVSSYPLFSNNQIWSFPFNGEMRRLQFTAHGAEGVYNATIALLDYNPKGDRLPVFRIDSKCMKRLRRDGIPDRILEKLASIQNQRFVGDERFSRRLEVTIGDANTFDHRGILERAKLTPEDLSKLALPDFVEYSPPFMEKSDSAVISPPVWLTVVGRHGVWPLEFYSDTDPNISDPNKSYVFPARPSNVPMSPAPFRKVPIVTWILFILFSLVCAGNCLLYCEAKILDRPGGLRSGRRRVFQIFCPARRHELQHAGWLFAYFLTLLGLYASIGFLLLIQPMVDGLRSANQPGDSPKIILIVGCCFVLLMTTIAALAHWIYLLARVPAKVFRFLRARKQSVEDHTSTTTPDRTGDGLLLKALKKSLALILLAVAGVVVLSVTRKSMDKLIQDKKGRSALIIIYDRATNVTSGVSPVVPIVFLGGGLCLWSLLKVRRLRWLQDSEKDTRLSCSHGLLGTTIHGLKDDANKVLENPWKNLSFLLLVLVFFAVPSWVAWRSVLPTFEGKWFDLIFEGVLGILYLAMVCALLQFLWAWRRFDRLLRRLASHPLVEAFDRLPASLPKSTGRFWTQVPAEEDLLQSSARRPFLLVGDPAGLRDKLAARLMTQSGTGKSVTVPETNTSTFTNEPKVLADTEYSRHSARSLAKRYFAFAPQARVALLNGFGNQLAFKHSTTNGHVHKLELGPADRFAVEVRSLAVSETERPWLSLAEDVIAIEVVTFICKVLVHLRNLLTFVTTGAFLILATVTSYPFQPQRLLTIFMWGVILSLAVISVIVVVKTDRDEVLSRIARTLPNQVKVDRVFVSTILTYGVLPILGLLVTQIPEIDGIVSLVEPVLRAFK